MYYPKTGMKNMICIVDWNKVKMMVLQRLYIMYDNLQERISSFGWDTKMVDGHDTESIRDSFNDMDGDKPLCIILDTIKVREFRLWKIQKI